MRKAVTVFLDANILFSAALGGEAFAMLWELSQQEKVALCSSTYCLIEARRNIGNKCPQAMPDLETKLADVRVVAHAENVAFPVDLNVKDLPVLAAAVAAGVEALLTGDVPHFGPLMNRRDLPLWVMTLREFLLHY
ncbi:MAG: PIN domain-containing protein [Acidithiobacillus sp.]